MLRMEHTHGRTFQELMLSVSIAAKAVCERGWSLLLQLPTGGDAH